MLHLLKVSRVRLAAIQIVVSMGIACLDNFHLFLVLIKSSGTCTVYLGGRRGISYRASAPCADAMKVVLEKLVEAVEALQIGVNGVHGRSGLCIIFDSFSVSTDIAALHHCGTLVWQWRDAQSRTLNLLSCWNALFFASAWAKPGDNERLLYTHAASEGAVQK